MPPKKRKRADHGTLDSSTRSIPTRAEVKASYNELFQDIDDAANLLDPKIVSRFLVLKQWQRSLLDALQSSTTELQEVATQHEQVSLAVQAGVYEEAHVNQQLARSQDVRLPHLEALAKEELVDSMASGDDLLSEFLGSDVKDPSNKQRIIGRLHQEWNARGGLERDLKVKQQELKKVQDEFKHQQSFLNSLPDHLASLERASASLNKAVTKSPGSSNYSPHLARMSGPERKARLDMATYLPTPLYTLHQQLQFVLDRPWTLPRNSNISEMTLGVSSSGENDADKQVLLHVPVPDVVTAQSRSRRVTIHFYYNQDMAAVTAAASGCGTTLNQDILLEELFPHDSPRVDIEISSSHIRPLPYHWCNVLAGLHGADPTTPSVQTASTRVILQQLQRRIRANATLKHVLHSLNRLVVPAPPGAERLGVSAKLTNFAMQEDAGGNTKTFSVTFRKGDTEKSASVGLNLARYPSEPPLWSWTGTDSLYESEWVELERYVNVDGLDQLVGATAGEELDRPGEQDEPQTSESDAQYEWILVHQLREILRRFEGM